MKLVMPMSGRGQRFKDQGYKNIKPLIEINGKPILQRMLEMFPERWGCVAVCADDQLSTDLPAMLKKQRPQSILLSVPSNKDGPFLAIEKAISVLKEDDPVIVSYCDYGMIWDPSDFQRFVENTECDAAVICYRGFHAHYLSAQTYAYCRLEGERVVEVREKGSFTDQRENEYASTGTYYFRSVRILKEALEHQKKTNLRVNGEFYTSLTVQCLLNLRPESLVSVYEVEKFFQWGTPEELERYQYWEKTYQSRQKSAHFKRPSIEQILMPMAGKGSRLKINGIPKPFLPIHQKPMYLNALDSLPIAKRISLVALAEHDPFFKNALPRQAVLKLLETTPPGQALTTKEGLTSLEENEPLIVSSCDHAIVIHPQKIEQFLSDPDCDAAVFTVHGFPEASKNPKAFAYVQCDIKDKAQFPLVDLMSVKAPLSERPQNDHVFVGTFWFRSMGLLRSAITDLIQEDCRVNNELYLDSVVNILIKLGKKVRRIELDGYINWGDTESLADALYWQEVFTGRKISIRGRYPGIGGSI